MHILLPVTWKTHPVIHRCHGISLRRRSSRMRWDTQVRFGQASHQIHLSPLTVLAFPGVWLHRRGIRSYLTPGGTPHSYPSAPIKKMPHTNRHQLTSPQKTSALIVRSLLHIVFIRHIHPTKNSLGLPALSWTLKVSCNTRFRLLSEVDFARTGFPFSIILLKIEAKETQITKNGCASTDMVYFSLSC